MSRPRRPTGTIRPAVVALAALLLAGCVGPSASPPPAVGQPGGPMPPSPPPDAAASFELAGAFVQGGVLGGRVPAGATRLLLDGKPVPIAADGRFIIAFGRDAPPAARLVATLASGGIVARDFAVGQRRWDIQSLPTLARGTTPTAEFTARRNVELARIDAARLAGSDSDGWRQRFVWPAKGRISGMFGSQRIYAGEPGAFHGGVDVARPTGAVVVAPADGVVVLAADAPFTLEGNLLMIDHGMGLNSAFLHLSRIDVRVGDRVRQGQPIGLVGATGRATGPHLHWGMKWRDERIDPALLAGPMPGG